MRPRALLRTLLLLAPGGACVAPVGHPGVALSSSPPGAEVWVDGEDTGFLTPCHVDLDKSDPHEVEFRLDGYAPRSYELRPARRAHLVHGIEGNRGVRTWGSFLWLPWDDFFGRVKYDSDLLPSRIHARLELAAVE